MTGKLQGNVRLDHALLKMAEEMGGTLLRERTVSQIATRLCGEPTVTGMKEEPDDPTA